MPEMIFPSLMTSNLLQITAVKCKVRLTSAGSCEEVSEVAVT